MSEQYKGRYGTPIITSGPDFYKKEDMLANVCPHRKVDVEVRNGWISYASYSRANGMLFSKTLIKVGQTLSIMVDGKLQRLVVKEITLRGKTFPREVKVVSEGGKKAKTLGIQEFLNLCFA